MIYISVFCFLALLFEFYFIQETRYGFFVFGSSTYILCICGICGTFSQINLIISPVFAVVDAVEAKLKLENQGNLSFKLNGGRSDPIGRSTSPTSGISSSPLL